MLVPITQPGPRTEDLFYRQGGEFSGSGIPCPCGGFQFPRPQLGTASCWSEQVWEIAEVCGRELLVTSAQGATRNDAILNLLVGNGEGLVGTGMVMAPVLLKWLSLMLSVRGERRTPELLPKTWREEMFCSSGRCSAVFPGNLQGGSL